MAELLGGGLLRQALQASFLANMDPSLVDRLLEDAVRLDIPAGSVTYREGEPPRMALVVAGLIRVYLTSIDGRQLTVRYARQGSVLGVPTVVVGPVQVGTQAVTDASVLVVSVARLRELGHADALFAWALAEQIGERLNEVLAACAGNAFGTVRQRVMRHLLDLAVEHQRDAHLVAPVSQQELADAVGTVREVVARVLRDLRAEGLVENGPSGIVLLQPDRLHDA
jgi:CRP/FNR family cyclic AMP-dependent transcriptional regulator